MSVLEQAKRVDRRANAAELRSIREYVLGPSGPGVVIAARRLGRSKSYVSEALRGRTPKPLTLSDLRKLRTAVPNEGVGK